ncbi:DUF395-domain-containing protein [Macrolepiota fuliginosa MF-IS2]|uniref:DUF395-domain-containing protein n=1 Tax=Macrolepiota fuliginosa MF-IS2 TaxID=1400762 RepID=A0A9P5XPP8_9AGAR|nr:DUF395-domain-containing protein [Macrolepiota fuliginosa MF-IS2]
MAAPAPLNSFLGGLTLPIPVHTLMLLNGNVFGISGFVHRAARGSSEALAAVAGLILGGAAVGLIEGGGPQSASLSFSQLATSGFLVGLGTRLSNGCTSGHMVCGVARFSVRSIVATATFFATGVITAHITYGHLGATAPLDWSLGSTARELLFAQIVPFAVSALLYLFASSSKPAEQPTSPKPSDETPLKEPSAELAPEPVLRHLTFLTTSTQFALALQVSGLTNPDRVVRFLLLPFHRSFDPSLAFLAAGVMPLAMFLYHYARGKEVPWLGGKWSIPKGGEIDWKLVAGAAVFGIGWGLAGVCPGPGLVNFGRALVHNEAQLSSTALWLAAVATGGLLV